MATHKRIDDAIDHDPDNLIVTIAQNLRRLSNSDQDSELFVREFVEIAPNRAKKRLAALIEEDGHTADSVSDEELRKLVHEAIEGELIAAIVLDDYFDEAAPPEQ